MQKAYGLHPLAILLLNPLNNPLATIKFENSFAFFLFLSFLLCLFFFIMHTLKPLCMCTNVLHTKWLLSYWRCSFLGLKLHVGCDQQATALNKHYDQVPICHSVHTSSTTQKLLLSEIYLACSKQIKYTTGSGCDMSGCVLGSGCDNV